MLRKVKNEPELILRDNHLLNILLKGDIVHFDSAAFISRLKKMLPAAKSLEIYNDGLQKWDSSLVAVVYETVRLSKENGLSCKYQTLPRNLQDLIRLAFADNRNPEHGQEKKGGFLERIGKATVSLGDKISDVLEFIGEVCQSCGRFLTFRSIMRRVDFLDALDNCGPKALAIVSLISFLVGLILAFVGAVQLETFGAQIYVASLVTIGMCRIMGAIMVGIIMAGRTGSSYAATIGTMQVNEELDALQTMGLSAMDFLVLPRLLSLLIAMPILTMLSDFMGMLGGAFVGVFLMNLPYQEYWRYAFNSFNLNNFLVGIFHGFCFGVIIALCGCYSGLRCGRNADSVGIATTRSVVYGIVWMIVVTGIITVICQEIGV